MKSVYYFVKRCSGCEILMFSVVSAKYNGVWKNADGEVPVLLCNESEVFFFLQKKKEKILGGMRVLVAMLYVDTCMQSDGAECMYMRENEEKEPLGERMIRRGKQMKS